MIKSKRRNTLVSVAKETIDKQLQVDQSGLDQFSFPAKKYNNLKILIPLIEQYDKQGLTENWTFLKKTILAGLLDQARKLASKKNWSEQFWAARYYAMSPIASDNEQIIKLLASEIPLVQISAIRSLIKLATKEGVYAAVKRVAAERRLNQTIYLAPFEQANEKTMQYVAEYLLEDKELFSRAVCYKILLMATTTGKVIEVPDTDISGNNIELRIAAMKYLVRTDKARAAKILPLLLSDEKWEVRANAIILLGELDGKGNLEQFAKSLADPQWWVRVNAANTLKRLGETGLKILNAQDPTVDRFAYETAQHVLKSPH